MTDSWVRRVLVVEDEAFIRGMVAEILRGGGFDVAMGGNAPEAMKAAQNFDPDAAVLDIDLGPGANGLDVCDALRAEFPYIAVVFLTQVPSAEVVGRAAVDARDAYLIKRDLADPRMLLEAVEHVLRNGDPSEGFREDAERTDPLARLSGQQVETLRLIAEGLSNEEIARIRGSSVRAVEAMVSRIFATLGVGDDPQLSSRVAAARIYMQYAGMPPAKEVDGR